MEETGHVISIELPSNTCTLPPTSTLVFDLVDVMSWLTSRRLIGVGAVENNVNI